MDAGIMDGSSLECGGVGAVRNVKNPIKVALKIMKESDHSIIVGDGAFDFTTKRGIEEYYMPGKKIKLRNSTRALPWLLEKNTLFYINRPCVKNPWDEEKDQKIDPTIAVFVDANDVLRLGTARGSKYHIHHEGIYRKRTIQVDGICAGK